MPSSSSASSASSQGELVQAAADALGTLTPGGVGRTVEGIAIFFGVVTVIVGILRIWVRSGFSDASMRVWGVDDYLVVLGTLPFIPAVVFAVYAARYGVGSHDSHLPSIYYQIRAAEYEVYWEICYFVSSTIIKCAVGFTCIRLDRRKRVLIPISINMLLMVIIAFLALLFVFLNCRPFAATWNPYLGTCQTHISMTTVSYIVSAVQVVTDWACAIMPFFIVAGLQMSMRKKVSVTAILGLGIVASICTVLRLPYLKYYDTTTYPTETLYHFGIVNILSTTECGLGIIGCSLPPLRKLFKFYYGSTNQPNYPASGHSSNMFRGSGYGIKLGSLGPGHGEHRASAGRSGSRSAGRELDDTLFDDDNSSRKGIMRKTEVVVENSLRTP